jgi:hypothetical protein
MLTVLRGSGSLAGGSLLLVLACSGGDEGKGRNSSTIPTPTTTTTTTATTPPPINTVPTVPGGGSGSAPVNLTGGSGGSGGICNELKIEPTPVVPTVLLLVDNSSSMFDAMTTPTPWNLLQTTLMADSGPIKALQDKVRFGFTSFKGNTMAQANETDEACADLTNVPYALNNFTAIDAKYKVLAAEWKPGMKWETPTGHAFARAATALAALQSDPPGPKNILLVTDGNPNTCQIVDPQCGQDLSIKAVQDAYAQDIKTFVVGIGEVIAGNVGCEPAWGRCGPDHLQDIANAGLGLPVEAPPEQFVWQSCADRYGRVLQGTYMAGAGGDAKYYTATNQAELTTAIQGLLNSVLSCTVEMNARVTGNAALGQVAVNGSSVGYQDPNGWQLEADTYSVTLNGAACETFKATGELHIAFPCDPQGRPIVELR